MNIVVLEHEWAFFADRNRTRLALFHVRRALRGEYDDMQNVFYCVLLHVNIQERTSSWNSKHCTEADEVKLYHSFSCIRTDHTWRRRAAFAM